MAKIISVHSFRGGTGKSNTVANLSALLAAQGKRVGVMDTDIQSPGIHVLFGLEDTGQIEYSLNDYLWGKATIEQVAYDVTPSTYSSDSGALYLIPSSIKPGEIARILKDGYEVRRLHQGIRKLVESLNLDTFIIDTHPGLNEETLLSFALSDVVVIVMRPDKQDYQGTGVTVRVAGRLKVKRMVLVMNKVPEELDFDQIKQEMEQTYECEVAAVLPHSNDMMLFASDGLFVHKFPEHPITKAYQALLDDLVK